jgi:hypothetical protein
MGPEAPLLELPNAEEERAQIPVEGNAVSPYAERADLVSATFYGVKLDTTDPFLRRNLNRLRGPVSRIDITPRYRRM